MNGPTIEPSAAVLHELRTPLGFLVTAARAAAEECPADASVLYQVRNLERVAMRLLASAEQVLAVALAERDQSTNPFDAIATARRAIEDSICVGLAIKLSATCEHDAWIARSGNEAQLDALIQSLLNNAVQHGDADGAIEVTVTSCAERFSMEVRNRVGRNARRGLGLGMEIAAQLAARLGASLVRGIEGTDFVARIELHHDLGTQPFRGPAPLALVG